MNHAEQISVSYFLNSSQCWDNKFSKVRINMGVSEHDASKKAISRYGTWSGMCTGEKFNSFFQSKALFDSGVRLTNIADDGKWSKSQAVPGSRALIIETPGFDCEYQTQKVISSRNNGQAGEFDLSALCQKAPLMEILDALRIMDQQGLSVSPEVYASIMQRCKRLVEAKLVQGHIFGRGLEVDSYLGSRMVDMFVKCGSLVDAEKVFNRLPRPNEFAWNALISAYMNKNRVKEALRMYQKMQAEGFRPSKSTMNSILKACSRKLDLELGKLIRADVVKYGYESDIFVGTTLLNMYLKCGSMIEAMQIFDDLSCRDVVTWTAMIQGYAQQGKADVALQLYSQMQDEGIIPDGQTFVAVLKACGSLAATEHEKESNGQYVKTGTLEKGRFIHSQIISIGLESNIFVGNALIDMYAKCGSMNDALQVFNNLQQRDVVTWTTLISAYAQKDQGELALQFYQQMHEEGMVPDGRTFVAVLKACGSLAAVEAGKMAGVKSVKTRSLKKGKLIHSQIVKMGLDTDIFVHNSLVDMYAKCGSMVDARQVFDNMRHRDVVTWNALILGYIQHGEIELALQLFTEMQGAGIVPDAWSFVAVLKACGSLAALEDGKVVDDKSVKERSLQKVKHLHSLLLKTGSNSDPLVSTTLVDIYAKCGSMKDAQQLFDNLPQQNVGSWNALISGYVRQNDGESALRVYTGMKGKGLVPNDRTFIALLKACTSLAALEHEKVIYGKPVKIASLEKGRFIHSEITKTGLEFDKFLGTTLVDVYVKCGSMVDAQQVFDKLQDRDVVTWTAIISGYAYQEECQLAMEMFGKMLEEGVVPDEETYCNMLKGCGKAGSLRLGKEIHAEIVQRSLWSSTLAAHLIEMYGRCGSMVDAQEIFEQFPKQGIELWNALIGGYARNGESELALQYLERMERSGTSLNQLTYTHVLSACSHAGLVDTGLQYIERMTKEYGISPTVEYFGCKIDLLGRAGLLKEAEEVLLEMPMPPSLIIWTTLLGACRKFGNVEIGRRTFDAARRHSPNAAAIYVLMSNIYAAAYMWERVEEIQKMRTDGQVWKTPGQSWIEVDGKVHVFVVGDKTHPRAKEIYAELKKLSMQMEEEGYVPHLESVLHRKGDESKLLALCGHSEKLAIAFGLISTSSPEPILVIKNLRSCPDCHNAVAFISKITGRTISVRDANRFHHFKDGSCSCGGFW
ncbi:hypothetical protein O6H91_19G042000 [Diphasiastrum complanatum]|uniref:Uncharacterized protein n=1 Tax=Diphasiastrum complanatum TaxID=34168 RepID=A0ACC2AVW0_DIPCM|nr:hypothetical protein O6H91_19G042000 [Diphasiastrum complanatum]